MSRAQQGTCGAADSARAHLVQRVGACGRSPRARGCPCHAGPLQVVVAAERVPGARRGDDKATARVAVRREPSAPPRRAAHASAICEARCTRWLRARAARARLRRNLDSCAYTAAQCAGPLRGGCGAAAAAAAAQPRFRGVQLCGSGRAGSAARRAASRTLAQRVAEASARRASMATAAAGGCHGTARPRRRFRTPRAAVADAATSSLAKVQATFPRSPQRAKHHGRFCRIR